MQMGRPSEPPDDVTQVVLHDLPVDLFQALDEVTEGLLRDYALTVLSGEQPFTLADVGVARAAKQLIVDQLPLEAESAVVTVSLGLTAEETSSYGVLQAVLDHANRLAHAEELLAMPVLPELVTLRNWCCDEVVAQSQGAAPRRWQPITAIADAPRRPRASWPGMADLPADQAWIAGDDGNVIIGASPAALELLGWDNLVGERLLVVIPPAYRQRHIAAFTRGVVTGVHRVLGQPLSVLALTSEGDELPITLTLSQHAGGGGRPVYLAMIRPA